MFARRLIPMAVLSLASAGFAAQQTVAPDSTPGPAKSGLFDRVIANQKKEEAALDLYERIERVEMRKNPSTPASAKVSRVVPSGTGMDRIPVGPDGRAADAAAYRAELERLEKALALVVEGRSQREAVEKYAKRRKERLDLIDSTRSAFLFSFLSNEPREDRMLAKYRMVPNPGFRPTSRLSSIFPKVRGFVWVDEASGELARVEGDVTEDISIGLILGKIYKGSHFMQERYELIPGLWFASFSQYDFDGRKLFSGFSFHEKTYYSNYRYIGPPKEALATIRAELGHADLGKSADGAAVP
ncbi:MAG TPA: hypothetical protein VMO76_16280 [Candidatus Udaeobacter sp.]|jgi:hypothetical protein|nr:hypothetical protein [Candidatus Udaeobacter sp.]